MTRYHVNPNNQVRKCSAISESTCRFGQAAHFEGTTEQAQFMQETLDQALAKPAPKPKVKTPLGQDLSFNSLGDSLSGRAQSDGTYSLYLYVNSKAILLEEGIAPVADMKSFPRHLGQVARTSDYAGHVFESSTMSFDPDVKQLRKLTASDGTIIGFTANKGGGWLHIRNLSELKSRPIASPGTGVLRAAYNLRRDYDLEQRAKAAAQARLDLDNAVVPTLKAQNRSNTTAVPYGARK